METETLLEKALKTNHRKSNKLPTEQEIELLEAWLSGDITTSQAVAVTGVKYHTSYMQKSALYIRHLVMYDGWELRRKQ